MNDDAQAPAPDKAAPAALNNVNIEGFTSTVTRARGDETLRRMTVHLDGHWIIDRGQPQFVGSLPTPVAGPKELFADFPPGMGGWGLAPSAVQYCLYGAQACFVSTFALVASLEGLEFRALRVNTEARINFTRFLGLGDEPVLEGITWEVEVDGDAPRERWERVLQEAEERCPAAWIMKNPVPVNAVLKH